MQAWNYIGELFRRVLFPTTKGADYASVLATLAIAATAFFAGIKVSEDATVQLLAYIGAITLIIFIIRLFFTVPYAMWREQVGEVANLRLELSKPERLELELMAQHRAKVRAGMAGAVREMMFLPFSNATTIERVNTAADLYKQLINDIGRAGLAESCDEAMGILYTLVEALIEDRSGDSGPAFRLEDDIINHLHGRLTGEALALRLPKGTESKTLL